MTPRFASILTAVAFVSVAFAGCLSSGAPAEPALPAAAPELEPTGQVEAAAPAPEAAFALSDVSVDPARAAPGDRVTLSATVTNTGAGAGATTATPLWNGAQDGTPFAVDLGPGASTELEATFTVPAFGYHDAAFRLADGAVAGALVTATAPSLALTDWSQTSRACKHLDVAFTVTNEGTMPASGFTLHVYSVNAEGRYMGQAEFAVPELAAGAAYELAGAVFAPHECGGSDTYTLEFITFENGEERGRETTAAFTP